MELKMIVKITTKGPHGPGKCLASIRNVQTKVLT